MCEPLWLSGSSYWEACWGPVWETPKCECALVGAVPSSWKQMLPAASVGLSQFQGGYSGLAFARDPSRQRSFLKCGLPTPSCQCPLSREVGYHSDRLRDCVQQAHREQARSFPEVRICSPPMNQSRILEPLQMHGSKQVLIRSLQQS